MAVPGRDGRWNVLRIGKPYRLVTEGLSEIEARAKAQELTK